MLTSNAPGAVRSSVAMSRTSAGPVPVTASGTSLAAVFTPGRAKAVNRTTMTTSRPPTVTAIFLTVLCCDGPMTSLPPG